MRLAHRSLVLGILLGLGTLPASAQESRPTFGFAVKLAAPDVATPFTGRVVVFLSARSAEPRHGPNWFSPEPMYAADFRDVPPGVAMVIDSRNAIGFPGRLDELKPGKWKVQAVVDRNLGGRAIGASPGNVYSVTQTLDLDPAKGMPVGIVCDQVIQPRKFVETARAKEVRLPSKLLSDFYGRPTTINCAVGLPQSWADHPERKYPVHYEVPGFGGEHWGLSGSDAPGRTVHGGEEFIYVLLDPSCPGGHHVFADSANNGPWGKALTTELIPAVEERFHGAGYPARFVTGHSSGGWSSFWLQVTYPEVFGGCWSTSPDPVDFRDFQRIDLYAAGVNMFRDEQGEPRPLARQGKRVMVTYQKFSDMERPLRGEQLESFEMAFSDRGPDGKPLRLWNRDTGAIDPKVAESWKKYDIGLTLRTHWKDLGPRLAGKLHVYTGDVDTFYLEGAVQLLQKDLAGLHADAKIEIFPGDHGSVMTPALRKRIDTEMGDQARAALKAAPSQRP